MTRYYLNNFSDGPITIKLTTDRTIEAKTSLPLNEKDVAMVKALKAKLKGKHSILDNLRLSTIRIEDDTRFAKPVEMTEEQKIAAEEAAKKAAEEAAKAEEDKKGKNK